MNSSAYEMNVDGEPADVKTNVWCKLVLTEELPDSRVGHTALYCRKDHKVILVGGATPHSLYHEVWILDLQNLTCKQLEALGEFEARYEHSAFMPLKLVNPEDDGEEAGDKEKTVDCSRLWVFAGANTEENKNDLWELNFENQQWSQLSQTGEIPSPRTYHITTAFLKDNFVVFSGGAKSVEAVTDTQTYQLDMLTRNWSIFPTRGQLPEPRQGHILVTVDNKLYCHGGMSGMKLFDDLHMLDSDGTWTAIECEKKPSGRAAHGAVYHNRHIYIFGGLGNTGALNDMWKLCIDTLVWEEISMSGSVPPRRLDFILVLVDLPHNFVKRSEDQSQGDSTSMNEEDLAVNESATGSENYVPYILLHGGMDETGHIFDDFHVMSLGPGNSDA